jgi:hypothetical protein
MGWTDIRQDCKEIDKSYPTFIRKYYAGGMVEFFETQYRRLLWKSHGHSLVGMETSDETIFYADCIVAQSLCCSLLGIIIDATIHRFEWEDLIKLWDERDLRFYDLLKSGGYNFDSITDAKS